MDKLSKREKIEIAAIVVILVVFVYFKFIISPIMQKNSELGSSISALNDKYNNILALENENGSYNTAIKNIKSKYNTSVKGIPMQLKDAEIENTLSKFCTKEQLTLSSINYNSQSNQTSASSNKSDNKSDNSIVVKLPVSITISGSYKSILNLISDMEKDTRVFKVGDFSITSGESSGSEKATISGVYYYINGSTKPDYDFNNGNYGKTDLFN
ncbi:Pilus assembly protein, PilO [Clostridium acidisoli DSM 12555]|uniref:Pilus assembly protein, PilO n=1 Tax=Clostridium acidisoli DSM 12555 TaxID=1121291 RepID=A0A1W1XKG4_9CLOT|nr:type 4a pilus biogenesis protein PilO [Clostridium acidisoli]SMC24415.1 Pilus assembly protein, PilO [Clostridium acidisoli DSM 12555]